MAISPEQTYIVIPAKDEAMRIEAVLKSIKKLDRPYPIVVVDDASSDNTAHIAKRYTRHIVRHKINLGPGGATRTGIEFALFAGAKNIVIIDADGQHSPSEIPTLLDSLARNRYDLVIGSRFMGSEEDVPRIRRIYNGIGNRISRFVTNVDVTDSQSGFRAMTSDFASQNPIEWNGFEFCIEMIRKAKQNGHRIGEVPISVKYTKETLQKGQSMISGLRMLARMIVQTFYSR